MPTHPLRRTPPPRRRAATVATVVALSLSLALAPAQAQLLPGTLPAGLPGGPLVERTTGLVHALPGTLHPQARALLRRHPRQVALDPTGAPVLRRELLAIDPDPSAIARARTAGFSLAARPSLDGLGIRAVVLRIPRGLDPAAALSVLRRLDPVGTYEYNHLYFRSGAAATGPDDVAPDAVQAPAGPSRIGLVDTGVDARHPALRGARIHGWGCGGDPVPDAHGTAVASLLHAGALFAADIYCGAPVGGDAAAFAGAMAWMGRERVPVVNVSLVGPDNALLRRATEALLARGHVVVAAVGNDGPASPPLYPAAYEGVIGVTAVDGRGRALPEALRGAQVDFAAHGIGAAAAMGGSQRAVRGTSFAAPLVARRAARLLEGEVPATGAAEHVRARLVAEARDLGPDGRDDTYGHGLVGGKFP